MEREIKLEIEELEERIAPLNSLPCLGFNNSEVLVFREDEALHLLTPGSHRVLAPDKAIPGILTAIGDFNDA